VSDATEQSANPSSDSPLPQVVVGRVLGAWGLKGDLKIETLTDTPDRFRPGSVLYLDGERATVERSQPAGGRLVVKLDVVADRTQAESRRGSTLTVPASEVPPLPAGSYYYYQIIGMGVWTDQDEHLGEVREILPGGGTGVYVVRGDDGKDVLLPARSEVVLDVNVEENRMTVRVPAGLR